MSPIFPFRCECGYTEDIYAAASAAAAVLRDHPPLCRRCGKPMKRIPGVVSVRFKGQGWSTPSALAEETHNRRF